LVVGGGERVKILMVTSVVCMGERIDEYSVLCDRDGPTTQGGMHGVRL
jgi:hypothetical protein